MDRYKIFTQNDPETIKNRILFKHGSVLAVYFPSGLPKDGGSCHFATSRCIKNCLNSLANRKEKEILNFFTTASLNDVFAKVYAEVNLDGSNMLYWFAAGDCPPKFTARILEVMRQFSNAGIIQQGFTRNKQLWEGTLEMENNYLVLTIEHLAEAKKLSEKGVVGVPNYDDGIVHLYRNKEHSGGCGADWFSFDEIFCENDCQGCYERGSGCFSGKHA
jgi:hypothetical protein